MRKAWERFVNAGKLTPPVPAQLAEGRKGCRRRGTDHKSADISLLRDKDKALVEVARDFLPIVQQTLGRDFVVILVNKDGIVLDIKGNPLVLGRMGESLCCGALLREAEVGNLAVTTALRAGAAVEVEGVEHFCQAYHDLVSSAAPILAPDGSVYGAIGVFNRIEHKNPYVLGMIRTAAQAITNGVYMNMVDEELRLQHKYLEAIVESISDGFVAIDGSGRLTYMNASAGRIMGLDPKKCVGRHVEEIVKDFKPVILSVLETGQGYVDREVMVKIRSGNKRLVKTATPIRDDAGNLIGVTDVFREIQRVKNLVNQMTGARAHFTFADIVGENPVFLDCLRLAKLAARSSSNVLIQGETGTGKELMAQAIHNESNYAGGPFVAINCGALPRELIESELFGYEEGTFTGAARGGRPGKFELANGGTIFLDEVSEIPLDMQVKLLRVLQERRVMRLGGSHYIDCDVRIIAATNRDLSHEVAVGNFRPDLYYRLNVLSITIPPLRDRPTDIELLVPFLAERISRRVGCQVKVFSREAMEILQSYSWPGNIRELENIVERALYIAQGPEITARELAQIMEHKRSNTQFGTNPFSIEEYERRAVQKAITLAKGNISQAARLLKISRSTLYKKLKKYNITPGVYQVSEN
ncbi:MAG: sigma 54-interacting transcriptional regulator [bacterium]